MKRLSLLLLLLFVCSWSQSVSGQKADSWVTVPLVDGLFTIQMPKSRAEKSQELSFEKFKLAGRVYTATEDGVDFSVWELVDTGDGSITPSVHHAYVDGCAELIWESLLKPRRDKIPEDSKLDTHMTYERELPTGNPAPGREYSLMLENRPGQTRFFVGRKIYILIVLNEDANPAAAQRFFKSLRPKKPALPAAATLEAAPIPLLPSERIGTGDPTDYSRVFSGKDVDQKARILAKPEPQYTEGARKFSVTGTVILRAVFNDSGQVAHIRVVQRLPHGLTERAIVAARNIKFTPAQKDGQAVSMWFQLEYNFNLY